MGSDVFEVDGFPLTYSEDALVVMHRDSHFAGNFEIMLDYYRKGGAGVMDEFSLRRIEELAVFERLYEENIATLLLTEVDYEKVERARGLYRDLRTLCETPATKSEIPHLVADLILTEDSEAKVEIEALAQRGSTVVSHLIELLGNDDFADPLFPGYGLAPSHALACLQKIGDKRAIIALFELIGHRSFSDEELIFKSLRTIGTPAQEFLIRVVNSRPITSDNEKAAMALVAFSSDPSVASFCLDALLALSDLRKELPLASYLLLACEGLESDEERERLRAFAEKSVLPKPLQADLHALFKHWRP